MHSALADALTPVLRDLETTGSVRPVLRDEQWSDYPGQMTAMLCSPDGAAQGLSAMAGDPRPQRVASVADQVQEWVVEELCSVGRPTNWPPCPEHPHTHPLSAVVRDSQAGWACPKSGQLICEIGQLPAVAG